MHFIYYINRLTATKVDSSYLGCLTSNIQPIKHKLDICLYCVNIIIQLSKLNYSYFLP